jgi:hypothetical protein
MTEDEEITDTKDVGTQDDKTAQRDDVEVHGTVTEHGDIAERRHVSGRDEDRQITRDTDAGEGADGEPLAPLLDDADTTRFRDRWHELQTGFVDEPREAVANADELVAELMQQLAKRFSQERSALEGQWSRGEDVSTEDLRISLQRYRSFFERLLAA